ncbi:MAG TPA: type III-A CRISPR-associated RAMP protein Csm4 [Clostridia bacterium]|nr:type III-A CRISPR-associated RAMP protein Csm4 [Clostridia bacterium]
MRYRLYKLRFTTPVHFGGESGSSGLVSSEMVFRSDSFFSALCMEAAAAGLIGDLLGAAREGKLLLSDLLPFAGEEYYLPKPFLSAKGEQKKNVGTEMKKRKLFKKLSFVPVSGFDDYIKSFSGDAVFDVEKALAGIDALGSSAVRTQVALTGRDESLPYHVGIYSFAADCGLYLIAGIGDEATELLFEKIMLALAYTGIGGKKSSGLGKFETDDVIELEEPYHENLEKIEAMLGAEGCAMTLNTSLPLDDELETALDGATYTLVRRGGFIASPAFSPSPLKKNELYAFAGGSCFANRFEGGLFDVSGGTGEHAVYRYLKPMFVGVTV